MLERFDALVHQIYEGCTDPAAWPRIIAAVADDLSADRGMLLTPMDRPEKGGFIFPHRISQQDITLWQTRYVQHDLWVQRGIARNLAYEGNVILGQDLVTEEELLSSVLYREFLSRLDIFHVVSGVVFGAERAEYPFTTFAYHRAARAGQFDEAARARLRMIVPHLSRALGVMFRLRDAEFRVAASLYALNQIRQGIVLLDDSGTVCFVNDAAESILREEDGFRLGSHAESRSTLVVDDSDAQSALQRALRWDSASARDVTHFAQAIAVRRPSGAAGYAVQVSWLPESNPYRVGSVTPCAVVFIRSNAPASNASAGALRRAYGLTPAEARAALALCDGGTLDAVAAQLNIKLNTLKTHVKSIYVKTAVETRAALTKLMLSLPPE